LDASLIRYHAAARQDLPWTKGITSIKDGEQEKKREKNVATRGRCATCHMFSIIRVLDMKNMLALILYSFFPLIFILTFTYLKRFAGVQRFSLIAILKEYPGML
ncbi:hypothetical protein ACJX0J_038448, partial [Zea mays]